MPEPTDPNIRERVQAVLTREVGPVEEQLLAGGVIDSLRSVEVALCLEEEFHLPVGQLSVSDLASVTSLVHKIQELTRGTETTRKTG